MKTIQNPITWTVLILLNLVLWAGCNDPAYYNKRSSKLCTQWLDGKQILLGEIASISKDSSGLYTTQVKFDLADGTKELRVYGTITYQAVVKEEAIQFEVFQPNRVLKMGIW